MEMPRAFSSGRRSVSTPVSVFTRSVLPWSIWPAVATITSFPSLLDAFQVEMLQLLHEFPLATQASQVHDERSVLHAPYHRNGKDAERLRDPGGERAAALAGRGDRDTGAREQVHGQ